MRDSAMAPGALGFGVMVLAVASAVLGAPSRLAQAEQRLEGEVSSFACSDLPEGAAFDVAPYSDDDLNLEIAKAFAAELRERKHVVAPGERFAVMMDARIELGRIDAPEPSLGRLEVEGGGAEVQINVWSTTKDSLLTGRRGRATREPTRLVVTATLRDRETGKALWRGEATGALGSARPLEIGRALMPALAEAFGCSLNLEKIPLPER